MLSIRVLTNGSDLNFVFLAREDSRQDGGESPRRWWGTGAVNLKLLGQVTRAQLDQLMTGHSPDGNPLVQNAGAPDRRAALDVTYSAPQSVSALWAVSPDVFRTAIERAHSAGVAAGMDYIQAEASMCLTGTTHNEHAHAGLVTALLDRCTASQNLDPQLHTHAIIIDIGVLKDGSTGTLLHPPIYQHMKAAESLYRAELTSQLHKHLGLTFNTHGGAFEICGLPQTLVELWGIRRDQIEKEIGENTVAGTVSRDAASLKSRDSKTAVPSRAELLKVWQQDLEENGMTWEDIESNLHCIAGENNHLDERGDSLFEYDVGEGENMPESCVDWALDQLTSQYKTFTKHELVQAAAELAQADGKGAKEVLHEVEEAIGSNPDLVVLGFDHLTTQEILRFERELIHEIRLVDGRPHEGVDEVVLEKALENTHPGLVREAQLIAVDQDYSNVRFSADSTSEKLKAVCHLTASGGSLRIVEGIPGDGKMSMLGMARAVWELEGYQTLGTTVSEKAAHELQEGSGIKSMPLVELFRRVVSRSLTLTERTVLVVDEASALDIKTFAALIEQVQKGKGMVVLVGDQMQIQSNDPLRSFAHLADILAKADLEGSIRGMDSADRKVGVNISHGNVIEVCNNLGQQVRLALAPNRTSALHELVDDWHRRERGQFHETMIFAPSRNAVDAINRVCQEKRLAEGTLNEATRIVATSVDPFFKSERLIPLYDNDRVELLKNSSILNLHRGDTGTVARIVATERSAILAVDLDRGGRVYIPLDDYPHVAPGYATTTDTVSGTCVDRSYILAVGRLQDIPMTCIQYAPASHHVRVYASEHDAGPELCELANRVDRSSDNSLTATTTAKPQETLQQRQELDVPSRRR